VVSTFSTVWSISKNLVRMVTAITDADEMVQIFEQDLDVQDCSEPQKARFSKGHVVFDKVSFTYENGRKLFSSISLDIKAGERVALVGHSGAGKSTALKLLLRFADVSKGAIFIDEQNIARLAQDDLRQNIAYVPQEPVLFHRSLRDNIAYAKPRATAREIEDAARMARAHEFIESLPQGYKTLVGERGIKLSGGERQRVAIARAMLKDAPVLVMDEATSSLDSISEGKIQAAFEDLMQGRTTIVIAHRLSTIRRMDRIIVFDEGKITEDGDHEALLSLGGTYAALWHSQVGGFIN